MPPKKTFKLGLKKAKIKPMDPIVALHRTRPETEGSSKMIRVQFPVTYAGSPLGFSAEEGIVVVKSTLSRDKTKVVQFEMLPQAIMTSGEPLQFPRFEGALIECDWSNYLRIIRRKKGRDSLSSQRVFGEIRHDASSAKLILHALSDLASGE